MAMMLRLEPNPLTREIFILAGQSNMSGRGQLSQLPVFPYQNKIKVYSNAGTWVDGYEPTDDALGQVDEVSIDLNAGVSVGLAFGNELYRLRPGREIGLVPAAKGAPNIVEWQPDLSRSTLYGSMIARAQEALAAGTLGGMLWWQGEADANNQSRAENWANSFLTIYDAMCDDLGVTDLKCVITELHDYYRSSWAEVQAQQRSLDGARDGNIAVVSAADIEGTEGGGIHVGTAGLVVMGRRYAAAMAGLL